MTSTAVEVLAWNRPQRGMALTGHAPEVADVGRLMAQCVRPEVWHVLDGTTLTSTRVDGTSATARLDPAEVPRTLEAVFGIVLDAADTARLVSVLGES